jgi:transcriptional regulator with XRE-family HTH domain
MNLGSRLRKQRTSKGFTLRELSQRTGVSEGFLSQVENNVKAPSLETLFNICEALDINPGDLLNELKNRETMFVISQNEWDETDLPHTGFATRRFLPPDDRTVIDSAVLFIQPSKSLPVRRNLKNAQEVLCVLKGRLELVQGDRRVVLKKGDAAHFWSRPDQQSITNTGKQMAVILWVGTM